MSSGGSLINIPSRRHWHTKTGSWRPRLRKKPRWTNRRLFRCTKSGIASRYCSGSPEEVWGWTPTGCRHFRPSHDNYRRFAYPPQPTVCPCLSQEEGSTRWFRRPLDAASRPLRQLVRIEQINRLVNRIKHRRTRQSVRKYPLNSWKLFSV